MELPHWLMAFGAIFLIVGFIGSILHENTIVTSELMRQKKASIAARLIRRRQPPHREFDLSVGKLAPIFNDGHIIAGRILVQYLPGLKTGRVQRQRKCFAQEANFASQPADVAQFARPVCNISRALHYG